jgi:hypothetical protein
MRNRRTWNSRPKKRTSIFTIRRVPGVWSLEVFCFLVLFDFEFGTSSSVGSSASSFFASTSSSSSSSSSTRAGSPFLCECACEWACATPK